MQEVDNTVRALPPGTHISQVYDQSDHELLILGTPGAGKTTLLLELTRELLHRAKLYDTHPIPVVFHLYGRAGIPESLVLTEDDYLEFLIETAKDETDFVVVSIFVNPTQFNNPADLDAYPRDERKDAALAAEAGVDLLFAPAVDGIYASDFATSVTVGAVGEPLEGAHRGPRHFDGVSTVVLKLLNIVGPDVVSIRHHRRLQQHVI